jgi:DNA-binding GntR family transcriptional regulator
VASLTHRTSSIVHAASCIAPAIQQPDKVDAMNGQLMARTRSEAVADHLRREILDGRLAGGTRLRQSRIAEDLGVSTTPVREAFAVLVIEGLLNGDPHKGVTVMTPSRADLVENYEMRIALESLATELAAAKASLDDVADLERLLQAMVDLPPKRGGIDEEAYVNANLAFHSRIYAIAERPRLAELIESLREQAGIYLRIFTHTVPSRRPTQAQHREVFDAIKRRAPKRAAKAMHEHLQTNLDFLLEHLEPEADVQAPRIGIP